jgi:hypothetical protein
MANIAAYHKGLAKKDVFRFLRSNLMPFPVLVGIGIVPVKPGGNAPADPLLP